MAIIRLYMTMSLDGYVAGPQDSLDNPMGIGGFRLFNWLSGRHKPGPSKQVYAEAEASRALISGRRTYEHADRWQGDHHDGVPILRAKLLPDLRGGGEAGERREAGNCC